jgi:hypothetical protein
MSESKSDALTNLATPLHRCGSRRPSKPLSVCPPRQRVLSRLRHIRPTQPGGSLCGNRHRMLVARAGRRAALANTALPDPSCGCCRSGPRASGRLAPLRGRCFGGGCRSLRPKPSALLPAVTAAPMLPARTSLLSVFERAQEYKQLPCRAPERRVPKMSAWARTRRLDHRVPLPAGCGLQRRQALADAFDEGVVPPTKKGTSAPSVQRRAPAAARAASPGPTAGSAPAAWWRRRSCRRPGRRPRARACRSRCRRPAVQPLAAAARARRAGTGRRPAAPGPGRGAAAAVVAALEVQRVGPVDQHEGRLQQVIAVGAPARRRAGTGSAWPAPAGRTGRAASHGGRAGPFQGSAGDARARDGGRLARRASMQPSASRACRPPAELLEACAAAGAARRRPGPAGQPVGQARSGSARPARRATVSRSSKLRVSPSASQLTAPGAQRALRQLVPSGELSRNSPLGAPRNSKAAD